MAIATMGVTVLDCPDPKALAEFYAAVLGWQVDGEGDWFEVAGPNGRVLAFQEAPGMVPPQWPSTEHSQQFHLDLDVSKDRLDEAEKEVLALGARLLQGDDGGKRDWRVYLDPAGHPFCLCAC
jgi:catechol 2,3-dioxygenase-like lactoylglutathione lyase family enzyme